MPRLRSRRLRRAPIEESDPRPGLLSIISLLLLLLPFLLLTTSPQKLAELGFRLPPAGEGLPPLPKGVIEELWIEVEENAVVIHKAIRRSDVDAGQGEADWTQSRIDGVEGQPDLASIQRSLREIKSLDPKRERIRLHPASETTTAEVVVLMDALRADTQGELFGQVVLASSP